MKYYKAIIKYFPCDGSPYILDVDNLQAETLQEVIDKFEEIWHMNAEVIHVGEL